MSVAATLAPTAAAQDARADAFALLNDGAAFDAALAASMRAEAGEDPLQVFVEAYVEAAGGDVSAEVVYHLLDGPALGHVAPPVRPVAFVPAPPAGPSPTPGAGIVPPRPTPAVAGAVASRTMDDVRAPQAPARTEPRQPRGP